MAEFDVFHLALQFPIFGLACCSHFWASLVCSQLPFLVGPPLPPITNHLSHDSHLAWRLQLSAKKHHEIMPAMVLFQLRCLITFFLRDINQKIFPILTVTDMSANQWSQFVKKDSGFAFLAYWNDMLVWLFLLMMILSETSWQKLGKFGPDVL